MALPKFKRASGQLIELKWTRLKTFEEAGSLQPKPPSTHWPGIVLGAPEVTVVGRGFDRKTIHTVQVIEDDAQLQIDGRAVFRRVMRAGESLTFEADRPWSFADLAVADREASAILRAHDFPLDREWPQPEAWAWSDGDLYWADTPDEDGFLIDSAGKAEPISLGMYRGGLDWIWTGRAADPAAAQRWPRFSPFGWALQIHELTAAHRMAKARLKSSMLAWLQANAAAVGADDTSDHSVEGILPPDWVDSDLDWIWRAGFELGAYLDEYRLRLPYGADLADAHTLTERRRLGGREGGGKKKVDAAKRWKVPALELAKKIRASNRKWGNGQIAAEICKAIPGAPEQETVEKVVSKWVKSGDLPASEWKARKH